VRQLERAIAIRDALYAKPLLQARPCRRRRVARSPSTLRRHGFVQITTAEWNPY
jgi:hypothetical protein